MELDQLGIEARRPSRIAGERLAADLRVLVFNRKPSGISQLGQPAAVGIVVAAGELLPPFQFRQVGRRRSALDLLPVQPGRIIVATDVNQHAPRLLGQPVLEPLADVPFGNLIVVGEPDNRIGRTLQAGRECGTRSDAASGLREHIAQRGGPVHTGSPAAAVVGFQLLLAAGQQQPGQSGGQRARRSQAVSGAARDCQRAVHRLFSVRPTAATNGQTLPTAASRPQSGRAAIPDRQRKRPQRPTASAPKCLPRRGGRCA